MELVGYSAVVYVLKLACGSGAKRETRSLSANDQFHHAYKTVIAYLFLALLLISSNKQQGKFIRFLFPFLL